MCSSEKDLGSVSDHHFLGTVRAFKPPPGVHSWREGWGGGSVWINETRLLWGQTQTQAIHILQPPSTGNCVQACSGSPDIWRVHKEGAWQGCWRCFVPLWVEQQSNIEIRLWSYYCMYRHICICVFKCFCVREREARVHHIKEGNLPRYGATKDCVILAVLAQIKLHLRDRQNENQYKKIKRKDINH